MKRPLLVGSAVAVLFGAGIRTWLGAGMPGDGRSEAPVPSLPAPGPGAAVPAREPSAASEAPAPAKEPAVASWELCGVGRVPRPAGRAGSTSAADGLDELPPALGTGALQALRQRVVAALARGGPRAQGAALLLQSVAEGDSLLQATRERALVQLARSADDAVITRWALSACMHDALRGACDGLSARDWTDQEPDNVVAWLRLMEDEPELRTEAEEGIFEAKRYDSHFGTLIGTVAAALPDDAPAYLKAALGAEVLGIELVFSTPLMLPLSDICRPPLPPQTPHQAECSALAEVLVDHSDTMLAFVMGQGIARHAGWPEERLAALKAERERLIQTVPVVDPLQPFACGSSQALQRWLDAMGQGGEMAGARQLAEGRPPR